MKSLNQRVLVSASVVLLAFAVITVTALDQAFYRAALAAHETRLFGQLYMLLGAAEVSEDGMLSMPPELIEPRFGQTESGLYARISGARGSTLWRSPSAVGTTLPAPIALGAGEQMFSEAAGLFVAAIGVRWSAKYPFTFAVFSDPSPVYAERESFRRTLWMWLAAMTLLLLLAQFAALRWGLRPLRRVALELSAIEAGKQDAVYGTYPRELARLTHNVNTLLAHERAQQARYRNALGDLAHSLKTPLAVLQGLQGGASSGEEMKRTLNEQVQRMDYIVQHQLQRAATAGRSSITQSIGLHAVIQRLAATLSKVYSDKDVALSIGVGEAVQLRADEGDMTELLGNLLDNAFKWCRARVQVSAVIKGAVCEINVVDDGPGIPAAEREALLERGARADQSVPGHGIGLAMVRDIVAAYGGSVDISGDALGGARVRVQLPC